MGRVPCNIKASPMDDTRHAVGPGQMRTAHNLATLTSRLLTAAKLLPPEDFWRLAAIVTGTLKEEEDASHRTAQDGINGEKSVIERRNENRPEGRL